MSLPITPGQGAMVLFMGAGFLLAWLNATEAAVLGASPVRLAHRVEQGDAGAKATQDLLADRENMLAFVMLCTKLAIGLIAVVAVRLLLPGAVGPLQLFAGLVAVPILMLLFLQRLPVALASRYPDRLVVPLVRPMLALQRRPLDLLVRALRGVLRSTGRVVGSQLPGFDPAYRFRELNRLLEAGVAQGELEPRCSAMVRRVVTFPEMKVAVATIPRVRTVSVAEDLSIKDTLKTLVETGFSRLPTYHPTSRDITGYVHATDVLVEAVRRPDSTAGAVRREILRIGAGESLMEAWKLFSANRSHMASVVEGDGTVVGVITLVDLLELLLGPEKPVPDHETDPGGSTAGPRAAAALAIGLGLSLGGLTGCGVGDAKDLAHQGARVNRIGTAVGAQACHVTQELMDDRDKDRVKDQSAGRATGKKPIYCIQSVNTGSPVPLEWANGRVRCPLHGNRYEAPNPLEAVKADIEEGKTHDPSDDLNQLALMAGGGGFLCLVISGFWYLRGGADADLAAALARSESVPAKGIAPGYRCVAGTLVCDAPLLVPRARTPAVAFRYVQLEEWEEKVDKTWVKREQIHKDETEWAACELDDGAGGLIPVEGKGARLEGRRLHVEEVAGGGLDGAGAAATAAGLTSAPVTKLTPGVAGMLEARTRNRRYVHRVTGLAVGDAVIVLGTVTGEPGRFGPPAKADEEDQPYLIAAGTRGEVLKRLREDAAGGRLLMFAFAGLAVACFVTAAALSSLAG